MKCDKLERDRMPTEEELNSVVAKDVSWKSDLLMKLSSRSWSPVANVDLRTFSTPTV